MKSKVQLSANHPILKRIDEVFDTEGEANTRATELESYGYECNIAWFEVRESPLAKKLGISGKYERL